MSFKLNIRSTFETLTDRHPALFYGLAVLTGASAALSGYSVVLAPVAAFLLLLILSLFSGASKLTFRCLLSLLLGFCTFLYALQSTPPSLPEEGVTGDAEIEFYTFSQKKTPIGVRWIGSGLVSRFTTEEGESYKDLSTSLQLSGEDTAFLPPIESKWKVRGKILPTSKDGFYIFKPIAKARWERIGSSCKGRLGQARMEVKRRITDYIENAMGHTQSAHFLGGMLTGEMNDIFLNHHLGRFGLQHILAISGFHFSLLASAFAFILLLFIPYRKLPLCMIVLLTGYFLLLGASPSILRAWLTIFLGSMAALLHQRSAGLNLLGASMIATVLYDPLSIHQLGFQCSFGITCAILLFVRPFENILERCFPSRDLSVTSRWSPYTQHLYIASSWIRMSIALNIAVNMAALPILLFHTQTFPLFSLLYNLFFPFLVGISMLLLMISTFMHAVFGELGGILHHLNSHLTDHILGLATHAPHSLDVVWRLPEIPSSFFTALLTAIFAIGAILSVKSRNEESVIFTF